MGNSSLAALEHAAQFIYGLLDWLVLAEEMKSYQAFCIEVNRVNVPLFLVWGFFLLLLFDFAPPKLETITTK